MLARQCFIVTAATVILVALAASIFAQSNSKEIMAQEPAKLIEMLKNPDATTFEKAKACQRLAVVGGTDAIPALAALLPDENLSCYARCGLEDIPDPAVDEALRSAATTLHGRQLVGVLDSIGQHKDAQAVGLLKGFLGNADTDVASAAAGALGRIGTFEASRVLGEVIAQESPAKAAIADGCLVCAEALGAAGRNSEALDLYEAVGKADLPKQFKIAALRGLFRIKQADALDLLLAQIQSPDPALFNLGLAEARVMPGVHTTAALAGAIGNLPAERQALLLRALGDRKERGSLLLLLRDASKSESVYVRQAAVEVLAKIGDGLAGGILLEVALGEGEVALAAKEGLKTIPSVEIDAAIVAKLAGADAKAKPTLLELVGARRIAVGYPAVCQLLSDADEAVRIAAISALGQLVELNDLELLTERALSNAPEAVAAKNALRIAVQRISDRDGCSTKLAACLAKASPADRAFLLELLAKVGGAKALETVVAAANSDDPAMKDAAIRVLGDWGNPDAASPLLHIVKTNPEAKYRTRALRGYIRVARQMKLPDETKLAMFHTVMVVAERNEEKQLALGILSRIPSATTLQVAVSQVGEPALKGAAGEAAVKIAGKLVDTDPKTVAEAMQKVLDADAAGAATDRAKQLLDQAQAAAK